MAKNIAAIAVLAGLAGIAWWTLREEDASQEESTSVPSFPIIATDRVDKLEINRYRGSGSTLREERIVLEKDGDLWHMASPVAYKAHQQLVALMLEALENIRVIDAITEDEKKHHVLEVDREFGVDVTVSSGNTQLVRFIVGVTRESVTFIRFPDSNVVYRTTGAYRRRFNKTADDLRDKTVTKLDPNSVTRVKYMGPDGVLEMVKEGDGEEASFTPSNVKIKNFNQQRAKSNAHALTVLTTRGFADPSLGDDVTGLGDGATVVEFDAAKDGQKGTFTVRIGSEKKHMRQTYAKTSLSDQIFLLSTHVAKRFRVSPQSFSLSDEQAAHQAASHGHDHDHEH
ncbi:MAG: DUF4340 domain-containing protein [Myxococcota bacterium]|nr:DUF4340 domain-containing protein [Myxococcota bacterium]